MNQSYCSLEFLSQNSLQKLLHFVGIRVFILRYEKECEKSFFCKTGCTGESLTTTSREFQSLVNRMARLYFFSYSDPAILTLQLPACFTCVLDSGESPLASQSRGPVTRSLLMHTLDILFTLSHTQPLHYFHLNTGFLNVEVQASLAGNKANTQLNKFNLTIQHLEIMYLGGNNIRVVCEKV